MLSKEALAAYRRMTPDQRLALTIESMKCSMEQLLSGPPEIVDRKFNLIRRQNDARNRALREALGKAEGRE